MLFFKSDIVNSTIFDTEINSRLILTAFFNYICKKIKNAKLFKQINKDKSLSKEQK